MTSRVRSRALAAAAGLSLLAAGLVSTATTASATPVVGPALSVDPSSLGPVIPDTVYGASFPGADFATAANLGWARWGGSTTSRFNYANGNTNLGDAYYFENTSAALPSFSSWLQAQAGRRVSFTIPVNGWVAKDAASCGFPRMSYATQDSFDPLRPNCGNGLSGGVNIPVTEGQTLASTAFGPDQQTAMTRSVHQTATTFGVAGAVLYHLDNEPSLWHVTHRDLFPSPVSSTDLYAKTIAAATAINAVDDGSPSAFDPLVAGPGDYGFCGWLYFPEDSGATGSAPCTAGAARQAAGKDYAEDYLAHVHAAEVSSGRTLLDVFDEHFYPQADGVYTTNPAAEGTDQVKALRLRSVRGLWDPTYVDESWIAQPVKLIPRMKAWRSAVYGTGAAPALGISEYSFGAIDTMNGALAQGDALGVLGREGVSYAALWGPPASATSPGTFAFRMFRNLDGAGASFGDQSVSAASADQDRVSVYAANRSSDGALTVVLINKTADTVTSPLSINANGFSDTGSRYEYTAADQTQIVSSTLQVGSIGSSITLPASSITTLVLPRSGVTSSLALAPAVGTLTYPATATLTATLKQSGSPLAGSTVRFQSRALGATTWANLKDVVTSTSGTAAVVVRPTQHTQYRVIDLRTGLTVAPATPSTTTTLYSRRSATLVASRTSVALGGSFVLSGKASPSASGRKASLQRRSSTGSWSTVASRTVSSTSAYSFTVKPTRRATYTYRVVVSADTLHYAATSPARSVKVT